MEPTDYKIEIKKHFEIGLNRSKINQILCIHNEIKNEGYTKEMVEEKIRNEGSIQPEILLFLNDIENYRTTKITTLSDEINAIKADINKVNNTCM